MERNLCLLVLLFLVTSAYSKPKCPLFKSVGYTEPEGDIILQEGVNALNLTCSVYEPLKPNQELVFRSDDYECPKNMIRQVDDRSIQLYVQNLTCGDKMYYCDLKETYPEIKETKNFTVCMNTVIIGTPPKDVDDFRCISMNNDNMTCNFTTPNTCIFTNYVVKIEIQGYIYKMGNCTFGRFGEESKCLLTTSSIPQYRTSQPKFIFYIQMDNKFGAKVNNFTIKPFQFVIPNPPEKFTAVAESADRIRLTWALPDTMQTFSVNLTYRVLCQCEFMERDFVLKELREIKPTKSNITYYLTDLKYAHMLCDIRVALKSANASNEEIFWSKNASLTVRTKSIIPYNPPQTDIGSFDSAQHPNYLIYWKEISREYCNGNNFGYLVQMAGNDNFSNNVIKPFMYINNLRDDKRYTFNIWSKNSEGLSKYHSTVVIPSRKERFSKPNKVVKTEHKGGLHQLSWKAPILRPGEILTNYTVFWCKFVRDRPYQCHGRLNWTNVAANVLEFTQTLDENSVYQYAVSANSLNSSSGMVWAECTVLRNGIVKMRDIYSEVSDTTMIIHWSWDCNSPNQAEFMITYCPTIVINSEQKCQEPIKNFTFKSSDNNVTITNLTPYTTYEVRLFIKTSDGDYKEQNDGPLHNTTNEGAPSLPINLRVFNATNSSFVVEWNTPLVTNGVIKQYYLNINGRELEIEKCPEKKYCPNEPCPEKKPCQHIESNLESYTNYTVSVKACTVLCSLSTPSVTVETLIGVPGVIIDHPVNSFENSTHMKIKWNSPSPPRGRNDYYELNITQKKDESGFIRKVKGRHYYLSCPAEVDSIGVSVRAVNMVGNKPLEGPWSPLYSAYCKTQKSILLYVVGCVGLIIFVALLYGLKRIYSHCQIMRTVEYKLPPGLAPVITDTNLMPWNLNKTTDDNDMRPSSKLTDEQVLLLKMNTHAPSANSSGCSSGHESVTSSIDSMPISSVDSGTDQLAEEIKRDSLLRQRNVQGTKVPSTGYVPADWGPNYCKVGDPVRAKEESTSPYIAIDKVPETIKASLIPQGVPSLNPVSILSTDITKKPNPSYVPYRQETDLVKPGLMNSKGYVVAGCPTPTGNKGDFTVPDISGGIDEESLPAHNALNKEFPWQQALMETPPHAVGYVSVGDAAPPTIRPSIEHNKGGYVPHRAYEQKTIKED